MMTNEEILEVIRLRRDFRLAKSDWTQMPDAPLSDSVKQAWADYRQALRELPNQHTATTDLTLVEYPTPPS